MAGITNELMYEELLKIEAGLADLAREMEETVAVARDTNRVLAAGQARNDVLKARLFGNRFKRVNAAE